MTLFRRQGRRLARWCSSTGGGWALAILIVLSAWTADPAGAQAPAPQTYRITAGDKIGVVVFGQTEALRKQFPRLETEIALLKQQADLEQRDLNQQLIADYEQLSKSGLARKPTYIEIKREEARIEGSIARLKSESLRAELAVGDLQFKIAELHNNYQRRVMTELRETERSLLELTVTLPSAQRARATRVNVRRP